MYKNDLGTFARVVITARCHYAIEVILLLSVDDNRNRKL